MDRSCLLFEPVNKALTLFAKDPQWRLTGKIGFIGVLHTWSQTLMDHFHLHCLNNYKTGRSHFHTGTDPMETAKNR